MKAIQSFKQGWCFNLDMNMKTMLNKIPNSKYSLYFIQIYTELIQNSKL